MYQRSELAQNKRTIIGSYPDDGSSRKRDFDKRLPGTFQHDILYSFCPFSSYLCTLQKCIPALEVSKVPKDRMSQKMPPCKIYQVRASTKLFLHFEIRRFLGINWWYQGTCQKLLSGFCPLRVGGYPPFPLTFFEHNDCLLRGEGVPPQFR